MCVYPADNLLLLTIYCTGITRHSHSVTGFAKKGFPQCGGVTDGFHVLIEAPQQCPADYHNHKGWHSVIMQGLMDHNGCFTDVNIGWSGCVHDTRVLHNSELFSKAESEKFVSTTDCVDRWSKSSYCDYCRCCLSRETLVDETIHQHWFTECSAKKFNFR